MSKKIILILGAGKNVGLSIAKLFSENNYQVALASRSGAPLSENTSWLNIQADFSDPECMESVFETVRMKFGVPTVVVYNAYQATSCSSPFRLPTSTIAKGVAIGIVSAFAAIKHSIEGWDILPADDKKTFIYTGNKLNAEPWPQFLDLGLGKAGGAYLMEAGVGGHGNRGYRFYYTDERKEDGSAVGNQISGENHAEFYLKLAEAKKQEECLATFVGTEYVSYGNKSVHTPF